MTPQTLSSLFGGRSWEFRTYTWSWDRSREPFIGPEFPTGMSTWEFSCLFPELGQGHCGLSRENQVGILSLWKMGVRGKEAAAQNSRIPRTRCRSCPWHGVVGNGAEAGALALFPTFPIKLETPLWLFCWEDKSQRIPTLRSFLRGCSFQTRQLPPHDPGFGKLQFIPAGWQFLAIPALTHPIPEVPTRDTHGSITSPLSNPKVTSRRE